jgi:D-alanyl-D-alanine carboxypeptidase/D-alanyl-D-alanine-endopeptidase (penicillin-binding protein 4)
LAQPAATRIQKAFQQFENDNQLKHAISSLYIIDAKTGEVVFDKNSQIGLAPASTQKVITSVTAFELLGKEYRYKTFFYNGVGNTLHVSGSGDPTFGSDRYRSTTETAIFDAVITAMKKKGLKNISNFVIIERENSKSIPSGWIYEDVGNYYGAAPRLLNWKENQYDIYFIPGAKEGDDTKIDTVATPWWRRLSNNCKTGKPGSGDNAYVYFIPEERRSVIEGTIPAGVKRFSIAAADNQPSLSFGESFTAYAKKRGFYTGDMDGINFIPVGGAYYWQAIRDTVYTHYSPSLDSIIYWFNKKSINLYGEALVRTIAAAKGSDGTTEEGITLIKKFWKDKGLDTDELNMSDGSGLSPLNRVTTHAQVEVLKFAKNRNWFSSFYNALPEYNGMKMKSGTISDVKGFCGYQQSKDGHEYIFSFLVNNYSGKTSPLVSKMFKVLDELK